MYLSLHDHGYLAAVAALSDGEVQPVDVEVPLDDDLVEVGMYTGRRRYPPLGISTRSCVSANLRPRSCSQAGSMFRMAFITSLW